MYKVLMGLYAQGRRYSEKTQLISQHPAPVGKNEELHVAQNLEGCFMAIYTPLFATRPFGLYAVGGVMIWSEKYYISSTEGAKQSRGSCRVKICPRHETKKETSMKAYIRSTILVVCACWMLICILTVA